MTLNSVELGKIDLPENGRVDLDLPETVVRKLDHGQLVVRVTIAQCPPAVGCGHSRHTISAIRVEYV